LKEPIKVTAPSITIVFAWAIRGWASIQIGTPTAANAPIPLLRVQGVVFVRNQPNIDAPLLGPNQRLDDAGPGCEAVSTDQNFMLGVVDGADREGGTVLLGREARRERCSRSYGGGRHRRRWYADYERERDPKHA
jgi:hypothetical protein